MNCLKMLRSNSSIYISILYLTAKLQAMMVWLCQYYNNISKHWTFKVLIHSACACHKMLVQEPWLQNSLLKNQINSTTARSRGENLLMEQGHWGGDNSTSWLHVLIRIAIPDWYSLYSAGGATCQGCLQPACKIPSVSRNHCDTEPVSEYQLIN